MNDYVPELSLEGPPTICWEYETFSWTNPFYYPGDLEWNNFLNEKGSEGWELIQYATECHYRKYCLFKRQKNNTLFHAQVKELAQMILRAQEAMKIQNNE